MKYFTVGPVEMDQETLKVAAKQLPYFRNGAFSKIMFENERLLKESVNANNAKVVFLTGSGTAGMDAVVSQTLINQKVLIINGGTFGQRFVDLCEFYDIDYDEIKVKLEEDLTLKHFENYDLATYDSLLINMHETSCGKLYDMEMVSKLCKKYHINLIVDAISAYLCDDIDFDNWEISCLIMSSHKALGLEPGLAMIVLSDEYIHKYINGTNKVNYYLDLKAHLQNMERGQTPFTPAIGVCLQLNEKLKRIDPKEQIAKTAKLAEYFRSHFSLKPLSYKYSNALTPLYFPNGGAKKVNEYLLKNQICVNPCGGDLSDKMLRISHMGALKKEDYDNLISKLNEVML